MAYIDGIDRTQPNHMVTVVLSEFVPKHFWERYLHNQELAGDDRDRIEDLVREYLARAVEES